ncbi:MAG: hypothetical protein MJ185_01585 [Treponema sp.]|nr:hypothetical protein [Treponema sp.]
MEESTVTPEVKSKKKKNPVVKLLLGIVYFILIVVLILALWLGVNFCIRADISDSVPDGFSVHLRTDSVWDSVNPLFDLQAADILLSEPGLASVKPVLIDFRQSGLRTNKIVNLVLSRRLDFMLYENNEFLAVLDTGILSGIVKFAPVYLNFKPVENLSIVKNDGTTYFEYGIEDTVFYAMIRKNLVIASSSKALFEKVMAGGNSQSLSNAKKESFSGKLASSFAVTADSRKVLDMFGTDNDYVKAVATCLPEEELATVDFDITDHNLNLSVSVPFVMNNENEENPVAHILNRDSKIPSLIQKLPAFVQYYTVLSVGSLQELKNAVFFATGDKLGLENKWGTAQSLSGMIFHDSIDNLIFSWTDDEYAVLGLEQKAEPVFVLKIKDEKKRREVFETIFSSIILQSDTSLIMDNVRLPRIELPSFIQVILESFGIRIPSPYYMVKDGFMYFSQSPENLAAINAAIKNGTRLSQNDNWKEISNHFSQSSSASLYYNLERSIPFFLKSKSSVSKILSLYNIGRLDLRVKDSKLEVSLSSVESKTPSTMTLAGFPVSVEGKVSSELYGSKIKNSRVVFYRQGNKVVSYNLASQEKNERVIDGLKYLCAAEVSNKKEGGALWALTGDGTVYFLDEKLKDPSGFPKVTGFVPSSGISASEEKMIFNAKGQNLIEVGSDGKFTQKKVESFDDISTVPLFVKGSFEGKNTEKIVLYERSFMGGFHVIETKEENSEFYPIDGIGFGSPDVMKTDKGFVLGFVSQSGLLTLTNISGYVPEQKTIQLDGVFYTNVKKCGNSFVALSEDGTLYSIHASDFSEELLTKIKIPHLTARTAYITISDFDNDGYEEIFVCGDGNVIYGFTEYLDMIGCFPVSGYGRPLFMDLDGDRKNECICLSLDNRLNGWRLIY